MNEKELENLLEEAFAHKAQSFGLRHEQTDALFAAAKEKFRGNMHVSARFFAKTFAGALAAAAAMAIMLFSYNKGAESAESAANAEITRLQAELEKTKGLRLEFARLVDAYGREVVAQLSYSGIDTDSALMVAEENYVQNAGKFRIEFRESLERAKQRSMQNEPTNWDRRM